MNNNFLSVFQYWISGGPLLIPIACVCFVIWVYFSSLNYRLKNALSSPQGFEDEFERRISNGESLKEITKWLSGFNDLLSSVSNYVLKRAVQGKDVRESIEECRQAELPFFRQDILILSSLVAAAPLLGLLGTVFGMIDTFRVIAYRGIDTTNMLAGGISQALITTQFGLIVALPGVFGISFLKRKLSELEVRLAICESYLLLQFEKHKRKLL